MSRLTEGPIKDGDNIDAASLNDRYSEYSQSGALNGFNTRDGAVDLPQFVGSNLNFLLPQMHETDIGHGDWKHGAYQTRTGQTTNNYAILDSGGSPNGTLSFGPLGMTLEPDTHMMRVYWNLAVRPRWIDTGPYTGRPWTAPGTGHSWDFPFTGGGNTTVWDWYGCWAFWLQWDITDNTLTNFVNVPGQTGFEDAVPGTDRLGGILTTTRSTSVVPYTVESFDLPVNGENDSGIEGPYGVGWTGVDGAYHYLRESPSSNLTVYGIRLVFSGPFGAYNNGGNNYLLRSDATLAGYARLDQQAGILQACKMRIR